MTTNADKTKGRLMPAFLEEFFAQKKPFDNLRQNGKRVSRQPQLMVDLRSSSNFQNIAFMSVNCIC